MTTGLDITTAVENMKLGHATSGRIPGPVSVFNSPQQQQQQQQSVINYSNEPASAPPLNTLPLPTQQQYYPQVVQQQVPIASKYS